MVCPLYVCHDLCWDLSVILSFDLYRVLLVNQVMYRSVPLFGSGPCFAELPLLVDRQIVIDVVILIRF